MGCVLGKQGSIVARIRDSTGVMVRVLEQNKGQRRLDTGEEVDEVIELQGSAGSCDAALQAVAKLLRDYQVLSLCACATLLPSCLRAHTCKNMQPQSCLAGTLHVTEPCDRPRCADLGSCVCITSQQSDHITTAACQAPAVMHRVHIHISNLLVSL